MHAFFRLILKAVFWLVAGLSRVVLAAVSCVTIAALRLVLRILCMYFGAIILFSVLNATLQ
ncbi:hypothetical protein CBP36_21000 (plasmid) [Acidovorax carolinensis]|uniref:Uncharacterized protein n=1 Tax=Acidovorax carolinensis TaxID=553814 RepID=A0A240UIZ8_9BURK|nr:hypothetical protein [Acidovorax carolinensis]ART61448.1 hypothetical protein CBP36_21000 [Acidovorax carolinensis]